jgi:hypothetical protein
VPPPDAGVGGGAGAARLGLDTPGIWGAAGRGKGGGGAGGPRQTDRSDRAIDPSDLWRRSEVDRAGGLA